MGKKKAGKAKKSGINARRLRILVTGGTGFLGKRLAQKLLNEGNEVIVFSRHLHDDLPEEVKPVLGDIRDKNALRKAFEKVDVVYHLAICLNESDPDMQEINVRGTRNVAELCKESGVKRLIYMGSSGVLGETVMPAKEDFDYNPKTGYEKSKMEGEMIVKQSGVPYTIVRATIVIGPNLIWAQIFEAAKRGYPIIGSGKNYFHLVYVDDVVEMLDIVKDDEKAANQTFHVASKDTPTYGEVYGIICKELNVKMTEKHVPLALAYLASYLHTILRRIRGKQPSLTKSKSSIDRLVRNRIISTDKAKRTLGFEAKYDTASAVRETIKSLKIARLGYSDYELAEVHKVKNSE